MVSAKTSGVNDWAPSNFDPTGRLFDRNITFNCSLAYDSTDNRFETDATSNVPDHARRVGVPRMLAAETFPSNRWTLHLTALTLNFTVQRTLSRQLKAR